jgi:hypothetical protein
MACSGGEISLLHSPSEGHSGEGEGGGRRLGEADALGRGARRLGRGGAHGLMCSPLPGTPSLYRGEGCTLTPPQGTKSGGLEEARGGGVWGGAGQAAPLNPNPGRLGLEPRVPLFSFP